MAEHYPGEGKPAGRINNSVKIRRCKASCDDEGINTRSYTLQVDSTSQRHRLSVVIKIHNERKTDNP